MNNYRDYLKAAIEFYIIKKYCNSDEELGRETVRRDLCRILGECLIEVIDEEF